MPQELARGDGWDDAGVHVCADSTRGGELIRTVNEGRGLQAHVTAVVCLSEENISPINI